jgi:glycerol-3-phosphate dehydrogenase subunit C
MTEGTLEAPARHAIAWEDPDFIDRTKTEAAMRRIWDICHTCRRCFNLCDAFPRLFDLIDTSATGELDSVAVGDYHKVADACTLCDMCFMTKCPYVPPHELNVDLPHVMLRYRAVELGEEKISRRRRELAKTDRNGRLAGLVAPLANWANNRRNRLTRPPLEKMLGVDRRAVLPSYHGRTFVMRSKCSAPPVDRTAPAAGRKAVLYATCFVNYNNPNIGEATRAVLARNRVGTEVHYPRCCGMPQLEQGDLAAVADSARRVATAFGPWIDEGCDVIALVPSCALMLKSELAPDPAERPSRSEALGCDIRHKRVRRRHRPQGRARLRPGTPWGRGYASPRLPRPRAKYRAKSGRNAPVAARLRDSGHRALLGHGGLWSVLKEDFATAIKVGQPVARQVLRNAKPFLSSECPLAGMHILQGMETVAKHQVLPGRPLHPIELLACAYGIPGAWSQGETRAQ